MGQPSRLQNGALSKRQRRKRKSEANACSSSWSQSVRSCRRGVLDSLEQGIIHQQHLFFTSQTDNGLSKHLPKRRRLQPRSVCRSRTCRGRPVNRRLAGNERLNVEAPAWKYFTSR